MRERERERERERQRQRQRDRDRETERERPHMCRANSANEGHSNTVLQCCPGDEPELIRYQMAAAQHVRSIKRGDKVSQVLEISLTVSFAVAF